VIFDSRHVNMNDLGAWGMLWRDATVTGFIDGKAVVTVTLSGNPLPTTLQVEVDDTALVHAHEKDATRVIVRALDQAGRLLPFMDDVVQVEVTGAAKCCWARTCSPSRAERLASGSRPPVRWATSRCA
jgi:beta-galactosidase